MKPKPNYFIYLFCNWFFIWYFKLVCLDNLIIWLFFSPLPWIIALLLVFSKKKKKQKLKELFFSLYIHLIFYCVFTHWKWTFSLLKQNPLIFFRGNIVFLSSFTGYYQIDREKLVFILFFQIKMIYLSLKEKTYKHVLQGLFHLFIILYTIKWINHSWNHNFLKVTTMGFFIFSLRLFLL
jgi:hypothetical protein